MWITFVWISVIYIVFGVIFMLAKDENLRSFFGGIAIAGLISLAVSSMYLKNLERNIVQTGVARYSAETGSLEFFSRI